jgi:hypothetical protein
LWLFSKKSNVVSIIGLHRDGECDQVPMEGGGSMVDTDVLIGLADISVAILGFSGLIHIFRPDPQVWAARRSALSANIKLAAGGLVFAILPLPFIESGLSSEYIWAICSLFFGASSTAILGWHIFDLRRRVVNGEYFYIPATVPFSMIMAIVTVVLLLNAFGVFFERSYTPYLSCLSVWVVGSAWSFGRMIHFSVFHGLDADISSESPAERPLFVEAEAQMKSKVVQ